jgi:MFS family permease
MGIFGFVASGGGSIGVMLGGILTDSLDWHWIFLVNVPIGVVTAIVAMRALNELDTGITYINAPTIGAEAHLPFGGVKQTGNGHREGGWEVYEFYSETKVGYLDFSGALQRAQIDNYLGTPD